MSETSFILSQPNLNLNLSPTWSRVKHGNHQKNKKRVDHERKKEIAFYSWLFLEHHNWLPDLLYYGYCVSEWITYNLFYVTSSRLYIWIMSVGPSSTFFEIFKNFLILKIFEKVTNVGDILEHLCRINLCTQHLF